MAFRVLDKSTKEDLLDPKSDEPKAIRLSAVDVFYLKKGKFFKYKIYENDNDNNFVKYGKEYGYGGSIYGFVRLGRYRQDMTLPPIKRGDRPDDKYYSIDLLSRVPEPDKLGHIKQGEVVRGTTVFKWSSTDIDTIKTEAKAGRTEMTISKIWVNDKLVYPQPKGSTTKEENKYVYFVLYK